MRTTAKPLTVRARIERWPLAKPFKIARGVKTEAVTVVVEASDGAHTGRGECTPYARYGETPDGVLERIETMDPVRDRTELQQTLAPGAARNAVDCAIWDLEAKRTGKPVAELAGLSPPASAVTAYTLSLDTPEAMAKAAAEAQRPVLKVKLGERDIDLEAARLRAIAKAAPAAKLIVDANEGWDAETLAAMDPVCSEIDALFIEQPLPASEDDVIKGMGLKTRICADESCHVIHDLEHLHGKYEVANIKLDKTGGLTAAIELRSAATAQGFEIMIGCMVAGSLAMAPAYLLSEGALAVDLDGPLLLAEDRQPGIRFDGATMSTPPQVLWG
ncbi:MAG: N-acetyl-D-Glu racemase DgcA [Neomegalonema sp.]